MIDIMVRQLHSIGGPVLITLLLISVIATATAIYKLLSLRRLGAGRHRVAREVLQHWTAGDASGAYQRAAADSAALSRVVGEAINGVWRWPNDKDRAREMATGTALSLLDAMNRHVRVLETSVQAAPMLGLLGTVLGMIAAFNEMSVGGGAVDPTELAGGIWVALSSTALGLAIAIPFYFFTSWIEGRIERERAAMDTAILTIVYGPGVDLANQPGAEAAVPLQAPQTIPLRR
ncbi:MotA/TolQ/ExbB proton channel family protein [Mesorhizobium sp. BAC0120]|uniref:MotA/TolQ/ExbB proton channel family protein n=1 Tax=Mesorhizobium sp. BAC0120 TaxID=3090670 RepID=UPI00298C6470|nr:MotA/TolQ/ExbB proton channel family protein [Mesorhizobium sp. BAC0120]MDW6026569.1 MotA/TolQ/ExbB proton channel family protein [Mesorhizobium sp. BAC0120]